MAYPARNCTALVVGALAGHRKNSRTSHSPNMRLSECAVAMSYLGGLHACAAIYIPLALPAASLSQSIIAIAMIVVHCYSRRNNSRLDGWQISSSASIASAGGTTQAACPPRTSAARVLPGLAAGSGSSSKEDVDPDHLSDLPAWAHRASSSSGTYARTGSRRQCVSVIV